MSVDPEAMRCIGTDSGEYLFTDADGNLVDLEAARSDEDEAG
jgi:hypothetical protein